MSDDISNLAGRFIERVTLPQDNRIEIMRLNMKLENLINLLKLRGILDETGKKEPEPAVKTATATDHGTEPTAEVSGASAPATGPDTDKETGSAIGQIERRESRTEKLD